MAAKERKSGGDFVLESKHLVGLFMVLVVIFGVVFTLGYLLGRSQYDTKLRAAIGKSVDEEVPASAAKPKPKAETSSNDAAAPQQPPADWEFYHSAEPKTTEDHLQPPKKVSPTAQPPAVVKHTVTPAVPAKTAKSPAPANAPLIPKGSIMLQVAAVTSQGDALALAQALQQKKFPAFVITPGADKFYHVQVGPYSDNQTATAARQNLEADGFKSIVKR
jgi:septal ring-binding cell division protein DamX